MGNSRFSESNFISIVTHRQEFMCLPAAEILQTGYEVLRWKQSFIEEHVVFPPQAEICRTCRSGRGFRESVRVRGGFRVQRQEVEGLFGRISVNLMCLFASCCRVITYECCPGYEKIPGERGCPAGMTSDL